MTTADFIETIRQDVKRELLAEVLAELKPIIEQKLYANVFTFEEGMRYLKISESTLRKQVKDGNVPYFRQRENVYSRQVDLDKRIASQVKMI